MAADNLARIDRILADDYSSAAMPARPKLHLVERNPLREPYGPFLSVANGQYLRQMQMLKEQSLNNNRFRDPTVAPRRMVCYE